MWEEVNDLLQKWQKVFLKLQKWTKILDYIGNQWNEGVRKITGLQEHAQKSIGRVNSLEHSYFSKYCKGLMERTLCLNKTKMSIKNTGRGNERKYAPYMSCHSH